jgi:septal ring factor EnvC (AmiA/AmiB activator)
VVRAYLPWLFTGRTEEGLKLRNLFHCKILHFCLICSFALVSCTGGMSVTEGPQGHYSPGGSALEQRVARLERALKRRDEQLSTLRQEIQGVTDERDDCAAKLKQAEEELVNLKEENEVLKKKIDEILAPPPDSPPAKQDIYVVEQGDTLASIAAREDIYGDRARWKEIFEENKDVIGSAPDELAPGTKLIIPRP